MIKDKQPLILRLLLASKGRLLGLLVLTCLCILPHRVLAQPQAYDELVDQRQAYQSLLKRIRQTSIRQLNTLVDDIEAMRDYPLFPYLYYELVSRNISYSNRKQIETFLRDTQGVPIRNKLLKTWLNYLAKHNYKTLFLATYEAGLGTELLCRNLHIRRAKGQVDSAWHQQVEVIWLSGYSLPDACDPVLAYWRQQGKLRPDLAIARMSLAGQAGQRSLSWYLKRYAPKDAHYIADLWGQVRRNPTLALRSSRFPFRYPEYDSAIVQWGLTKTAWRNPQALIKALPQWQKSNKLSAAVLQKIIEALATSLTLDKHDDAREWLMKAASPNASHNLWRWYLMHAVSNQQWSQVIDIVRTAPGAQRSSSEFIYWQARAFAASNQPDAARQQLLRLANERHYYGFMAAAQLNTMPSFNAKALVVESETAQSVSRLPQVLRARELFFAEQWVDARREWFALMKPLSDQQKQAAIALAHSWQWHDQAIVGALKAGAKDELAIRFPSAYASEFEKHASYYDISSSFALAIARRESSFMQDALSSANARGVMQLLPSTADYLIKTKDALRPAFRRQMSRSSIKGELFKAHSNIEFGIGFLRYLELKLGDNPVLISAAYNAGWRKVQTWLPDNQPIPADIWIDTIPFKETREYVKAILAYQLIYQWHQNQALDNFKTLSSMQIMPP